MDATTILPEVMPAPVFASRVSLRDPADAENFVVCLECGQGYDKRNLAHALYHAEPDHDPFVVEG